VTLSTPKNKPTSSPKNKKQPNFKINLNVLAVTRLISFDAYLKARVL
jgi:hypothetical protein